HWLAEETERTPLVDQHRPESHHLLGQRSTVNGRTPALLWKTRLDRKTLPYPGTHPVRDVEIIPAAVLLNTLFAASATDMVRADLTNVDLRVPVSVSQPREVQVVAQDGTFRISSHIIQNPGDDRGL